MPYLLSSYDNALSLVLQDGTHKTSKRTNLKTISLPGLQIRIDLSQKPYFPLLTRRRIYPKSIFAELLWILSGSTLNSDLVSLGSNIWTPWAKSSGSNNLGPIYGHQLRNFGAPQGSQGFDQLTYLMDLIQQDPTSRRILWSLWNPSQLHLMALPPCHVLFQLSIDDDSQCTSLLYQRSGDLPIGIPANIQFYSALTLMICQQCNLTPKEFILTIGDAHIYQNQIPGAEEYLSRDTPDSPTLTLTKAPSIHDYCLTDFTITNYNPLPRIHIPVAV